MKGREDRSEMETFDLLSTVEYGGCSAKLSPKQLDEVLGKLSFVKHPDLLVDVETHDDAAVYRIAPDIALIFTTDFFPPVCSDGHGFGQIAAANALSDVYAMGGKPLLALNLMMFSAAKMPMDVYIDILKGGNDKVTESGALLVGGHTIDDFPPKYGLAVIGTVHPEKLITNAGAKPGDLLVLTKPIGIGALIAAHKLGMDNADDYQSALEQMKLLNKSASEIASLYGVAGGTDITGFGLLGHAYKMAKASNTSFRIMSNKIPLISSAYSIFQDGCIPGAAFRNLEYISDFVSVGRNVDYTLKMLACDAQTSGGLLLSVNRDKLPSVISDLNSATDVMCAEIIGEVLPQSSKMIYFD